MNSRRNITLAPDETQAIKDQLDRKLVREFEMSERKLIRYAILNVGRILDIAEHKDDRITAIEKSLRIIGDKIDTTLDKTIELAKETRGRPKRLNAKKTPEEVYDEGRLICEELGGTVQGNMCLYKVYEVAANKKPYANERGLDLAALTQQTIDDQYFPSKEEYEAAVAKYNI